MRKELHVSHIPQPPKPVIIPLSSKKKLKTKEKNKKKEELRHRSGWENSALSERTPLL